MRWSPQFALEVTASSGNTVTVRYAHHQPSDASCCPSLPDSVVRYRGTGTAVEAIDPLPPPDQGLAGWVNLAG